MLFRSVMINRDSRGHSYFIVRGEILGFMKDEQLRKLYLPGCSRAEVEEDSILATGLCVAVLDLSLPDFPLRCSRGDVLCWPSLM